MNPKCWEIPEAEAADSSELQILILRSRRMWWMLMAGTIHLRWKIRGWGSNFEKGLEKGKNNSIWFDVQRQLDLRKAIMSFKRSWAWAFYFYLFIYLRENQQHRAAHFSWRHEWVLRYYYFFFLPINAQLTRDTLQKANITICVWW